MSKILIIHNPQAGAAETDLEKYLKALESRGAIAVTRVLSENFNLKELLADASNFERVVVVGGDGTVSSAASILQGTGIPIVAYPAGTANLLASNLKMPATAEELAEVTLNNPAVATDLGRLEYRLYRRRDYLRSRLGLKLSRSFSTVHFVIMAGSGFIAHLVGHAETLKGRFGIAAYWMAAFFNLYPRVAKFGLNIDGNSIRARGIGILIVNFEKIQFDLNVVPDANAQDGKFEVVILKSKNVFGLIPVVWGLIAERLGFRRPDHPNEVKISRGSEIEVSCWPPLRLQYDGELLRKTSFFKVKVLPRAVHFIYGLLQAPA